MKKLLIILALGTTGSLYLLSVATRVNKNVEHRQQSPCIFCDVVLGKGTAVVWEEDNDIMAIGKPARFGREVTDLLIIPKKHVVNLKYLDKNNAFDATVFSKMGFMAQKLSQQLAQPGDFWVEVHNGADAFQSVMHLHMHFKSHSAWANPHKKPIRVH